MVIPIQATSWFSIAATSVSSISALRGVWTPSSELRCFRCWSPSSCSSHRCSHEAMVSIGAVSPTRDPDEIERALSQFLAADISSGLPSPDALTDLLALTNKLQMKLPRSTTTMFRALATLAGTVEQLSPGYPLIDVIADVGGAEFRERMLPGSVSELVQQEWAQLGPLLGRAPRHMDRIATLLEHGRLTTRLRLFTDAHEVRCARTSWSTVSS